MTFHTDIEPSPTGTMRATGERHMTRTTEITDAMKTMALKAMRNRGYEYISDVALEDALRAALDAAAPPAADVTARDDMVDNRFRQQIKINETWKERINALERRVSGQATAIRTINARLDDDVMPNPTPDATPDAHELQALQERTGEWGKTTFPHSTKSSIAAHLVEETSELEEACIEDKAEAIAEEAADCLLLLLHLAHRTGFSLIAEAEKKYVINTQRVWEQLPNERGYQKHVTPDAPTAAGEDEKWEELSRRSRQRIMDGKDDFHLLTDSIKENYIRLDRGVVKDAAALGLTPAPSRRDPQRLYRDGDRDGQISVEYTCCGAQEYWPLNDRGELEMTHDELADGRCSAARSASHGEGGD